MESINTSLFIISILLFSSAEAICVSRTTLFSPSSLSPSPAPSLAPAPATAASKAPSSSWGNGHVAVGLALPAAVKDICDKTDYSVLCVSSLFPYAAGTSGKSDVPSVLGMAIKACAKASESALAEVAKMVKEPSTPSDTRKSLAVCKKNYDDAIDNLKDAEAALPTGDVGRLNSVLSAALSDFGTCEDAFAESAPGARSPTVQFYDPLRKLASNCLAIASLLHS